MNKRLVVGLSFLSFIFMNTLFALDAIKEAEDNRDVHAPALAHAVSSSSFVDRARAARAFGSIQKSEGIASLLILLNDSNLRVQKEAIFALGQFGWEKSFSQGREKEITQSLLSKLESKDQEVRRLTVEALGKIALEETPLHVIEMLKDSHKQVRAEALVALYRYRLILKLRDPTANPALLSESQIKALLALGTDKHQEVQEKLAFYFQRVKDERGKELILRLAESEDLWTRFFAVSALSKYNGENIQNLLIQSTQDQSSYVRVAALQGVIAQGLAQQLSPALRGDPSHHVRSTYIQALQSLKPSAEAYDKIKELSLDSQISVRVEALKAMASFEHEDTQQLLRIALQSNDWPLRSAAAQSLSLLKNEERKEVAEIALQDKDVRVRVSALEGLSKTEDAYAYTAIEKALQADELSERGSAIYALNDRKEIQRMAAAYTCYQRSLGEKWIEQREEIVKLWSSENTEETTRYLRVALKDAHSSVSSLAMCALEERGISESTPPQTETKLSYTPYRELSFKQNPQIILHTNKGEIHLELYPKIAPIHVANMVGFAEENKYAGLPFHRVVSNFVVQGGDPDKSGWGSAGYSLRAEINTMPFERGSLGMPRSTGFDTGGIQFFINHIPTPHLDGQYTVFGKVTEGLEVIDQIEVGDLVLKTSVVR